jgi:hypothetical protein
MIRKYFVYLSSLLLFLLFLFNYSSIKGEYKNRVNLIEIKNNPKYKLQTFAAIANGDDTIKSIGHPIIGNLIQISKYIYSGEEPTSDTFFICLKEFGITTIVSVDGAKPDVETAKKHNIRYIHIPIGYDGFGEGAELSITRLTREVKGPIYFHCHHGVHRGPAAAAIASIVAGCYSNEQAIEILEKAGTSKEYPGLWSDVENFNVPSDSTVYLPELVEIADVGSFASQMASIDRAMDNIKLCRKSNWSTPAIHPDIVPERETIIVKEGFRELRRNLSNGYDEQLRSWLGEAEEYTDRIIIALKSGELTDAENNYYLLNHACTQCHKIYRN